MTAQEFLKQYLKNNPNGNYTDCMVKFAEYHTKQALVTASENIETTLWQNKDDLEIIANRADYIINHMLIKESILNAYSLKNIK